MVFNAKPEGKCGVGRPRLRWLDDVEADIKALGVKRWRTKAQDRIRVVGNSKGGQG
jgi:hypothetical protein